jgi:hypothetical protein
VIFPLSTKAGGRTKAEKEMTMQMGERGGVDLSHAMVTMASYPRRENMYHAYLQVAEENVVHRT